jgi:hypothetical protein
MPATRRVWLTFVHASGYTRQGCAPSDTIDRMRLIRDGVRQVDKSRDRAAPSGRRQVAVSSGIPAVAAGNRLLARHRQTSGADVPAGVHASGRAALQRRWVSSGQPHEYYWEGRSAPDVPLPPGGRVVAAPALGSLPPPLSRPHDMRSWRTDSSLDANAELHLLADAADRHERGVGLSYAGPIEDTGMGPVPVDPRVPARVAGHIPPWRRETGTGGANEYERNHPEWGRRGPSEVGHGNGNAQIGPISDQAINTASISHGANSQMMAADGAITGNADIITNTRFGVRPGTRHAEWIDQRFAHRSYPNEPLHDERIDASRGRMSGREWDENRRRAELLSPANVDAAVTLRSMFDNHR